MIKLIFTTSLIILAKLILFTNSSKLDPNDDDLLNNQNNAGRGNIWRIVVNEYLRY